MYYVQRKYDLKLHSPARQPAEVVMKVKFRDLPNEFALGIEIPVNMLAFGHDIAGFPLDSSENEVAEQQTRLTEVGSRVTDLLRRLPGVDYVGVNKGLTGSNITAGFSSAYGREEMRSALATILEALTDDGALPSPEIEEEQYRWLNARKRIAVEWYPNEQCVGLHFRQRIFDGTYRVLSRDPATWSGITPHALARLLGEIASARGVEEVTVRPYEASLAVKEGFSRSQVVDGLKLIDRAQKAFYGDVPSEVASFQTKVSERDPTDDWVRDWCGGDDCWDNDMY